jgi:hypothetical protein
MSQSHQTISIDCLANELLTFVFVATLPPIDLSNESSPLSTCQAPLNVSQVCRRWRHVALSSPQLWARISFDLRIYDEFAKAAKAALAIPILIERSERYPLDIRVIARCGNYTWQEHKSLRGEPSAQDWTALARDIFKPLIAERYRWRFARIVAPPELWQEGYDDDDQWGLSNIPMIEDLHFGMLVEHLDGKPENRRDDNKFVLDLSRTRMLETFVFTDHYRTRVIMDASATFPRLHTVHVKKGSCELMPEIMFRILAASPQLKALKWPMSASNAYDPGDDGLPHLRMETLRKLSMRFVYERGVRVPDRAIDKLIHIFDHLTLPQLIDFSLDLLDDRSYLDPVLASIRDVFKRSAPPLTKLRLKFEEMDVTTLLECLSHVPSLEELKLDIFDINYIPFLERLTVDQTRISSSDSGGTAPLCPNLKTLKLYYINLEASLGSVSQMLLSRSPPDGERYPVQTTDSEDDRPTRVDHTELSRELTSRGRFGSAVLSEITLKDTNDSTADWLVDPVLTELISLGLKLCVWTSGDHDTHDADMDSDVVEVSDVEYDYFE